MTTILGEFSDPPELRATLEADIGRKFAGARQNLGWPKGGVGRYLTDAYARGAMFSYRNANTEPWLWKDVTAKKHDTEIIAVIDQIVAERKWHTGLPYALSAHHEQTVDSPVQPQMGTPDEYRPMFEHVSALVKSRNAHTYQGGPIALAWVPSMIQFTNPNDDMAVAKIAPDPSTYHFVGVDWYNKLRPKTGALKHADGSDVQHVIDFAKTVKKPWLIGEFGCIEHHDKAAFLDDAMRRIAEGACWALFVTNKVTSEEAGGGDMRPNSNPAATAVFKKWANDPAFSRTPVTPK